MKLRVNSFGLLAAAIMLGVSCLSASGKAVKPVTPKASPEAKALLNFLYNISGKTMLTGQHNYPNTRDKNSQFAAKYTGKTPVIFSTDWGHAKDGDTDSHLARPDIVDESIRQHRLGSIVTICWHAVPPTADEPVTFRPQYKSEAPESLASVQGKLLDQQFKDILTPGTELNLRWQVQVDSVARYLKLLQDAHVPVLWRPYHEMNGDWFWWGGRRGEFGTAALYRQLFDRLVNHHKLNNLIWVWSMDRPNKPEMRFTEYYPGDQYLDVLSLDVYGNDFQQSYYNGLDSLSNGKPIALGEVGNPPTLEILTAQPKWAYYVIWAGMVRNTPKKQYAVLMSDPRILGRGDAAYEEVVRPYRAAYGLPALVSIQAKSDNTKADFSGEWVFNEDKSSLDNMGAGNLPYRLTVTQKDNDFTVQKTFVVEFGDDRVTDEAYTLDGKEFKSEFWNSPRVTTVNWSATGDTLIMNSKVTFNRGGQTSEMVSTEYWSLMDGGQALSIQTSSTSFWGKRDFLMVFDRR